MLTALTWIGAGVVAVLGHARLALWLLLRGSGAVMARGLTVLALARAGWWFTAEKVVLVLPLTTASALVAVLLAGPPLRRAARGADRHMPVREVVPLLVMEEEAPAVGGATRRRFVILAGGLVVAAAGTRLGVPRLSSRATSTGGGPGGLARRSVSVTELRGPTRPAPGGARIRRVLTARRATVDLSPVAGVEAWTYDGLVPGPAIVATEGDLLEVTLRNDDIEDGVTIHWHGYDVPCCDDGVPSSTQAAVAPGEEFGYRFRADQVGTYWYHTHEASAEAVRKGLYGTFVVRPRGVLADAGTVVGLDITLPVHTFGDLAVLSDRPGRSVHAVQANRSLETHPWHLHGHTVLVHSRNGVRSTGSPLLAGDAHDVTIELGRKRRGQSDIVPVGPRPSDGVLRKAAVRQSSPGVAR